MTNTTKNTMGTKTTKTDVLSMLINAGKKVFESVKRIISNISKEPEKFANLVKKTLKLIQEGSLQLSELLASSKLLYTVVSKILTNRPA